MRGLMPRGPSAQQGPVPTGRSRPPTHAAAARVPSPQPGPHRGQVPTWRRRSAGDPAMHASPPRPIYAAVTPGTEVEASPPSFLTGTLGLPRRASEILPDKHQGVVPGSRVVLLLIICSHPASIPNWWRLTMLSCRPHTRVHAGVHVCHLELSCTALLWVL